MYLVTLKVSDNLYCYPQRCKKLLLFLVLSCAVLLGISGISPTVYAAQSPHWAKLKTWERLTEGRETPNYTELIQFIRQNPEWPQIDALTKKVEENMPLDRSAAYVIAWYDDYPPETAKGLDQYLKALLGNGRKADAQTIIRQWWGEINLSRSEQKFIYRNYGYLIDMDAHRRRLDTLLFSRQYDNARGIANVLEGGFPALTEARIALARKQNGVGALIRKVPDSLQNDPGLLYERLHWRRENRLNNGAVEILRAAPSADKIQNPEAWWLERHIIIRRLLEEKKYKGAYLLASTHRQTEGFSYAQAEWMSGWLALEFLHSPRTAHEHFRKLYASVETPISKSRAAYWAGRAAHAAGDTTIGNNSYSIAAKFQTTYYGQLAHGQLLHKQMQMTMPAGYVPVEKGISYVSPPVLNGNDIRSFDNDELIYAAKHYHQQNNNIQVRRFFNAFVRHHQSPKAYLFAAKEAMKMKRYDTAVRIAKEATRKGYFLTAQSYPVITGQLRKINGLSDVEWALIHAIIRQESLFDVNAQSGAGARGLMQLMPATASQVAKRVGVSHRSSWLTQRPGHNILLGSAYLNQMIKRYDGAYPMAIAAYNAGPGRVDEWIKTFGDPRKGEIDWIDWIELMPIYETRNYVQRVMESVYIYRYRLKDVQSKTEQSPIHVALAIQPLVY